MSDVDKLSNAEERLAQLEDEKGREEQEARKAELAEAPVMQSPFAQRRFEKVALAEIDAGVNLRPDLPNIHQLALSIKEQGLISPALVRPVEDGDKPYDLIAGRRRFEALKLLVEDKEQPVVWFEIVDEINEAQKYAMQLTENVQRENMEPIHEARALRYQLELNPELTMTQLARSLGVSIAWVSGRLKLLELPEHLQTRLERGDLNFTVADLLRRGIDSGKLSEEQADELADDYAAGKVSSKTIRDEVAPPKPKKQVDPLKEGDDGDVPWGAPVWDPDSDPEKLEAERQARLEEAADEFLAAAGPDPKQRSDEPAPFQEDGRTANGLYDLGTRKRLDSYILGRLLREFADDDYLAEIGTTRDEAYRFASKLEPQAKLNALREFGMWLAEDDAQLPTEIFPDGI